MSPSRRRTRSGARRGRRRWWSRGRAPVPDVQGCNVGETTNDDDPDARHFWFGDATGGARGGVVPSNIRSSTRARSAAARPTIWLVAVESIEELGAWRDYLRHHGGGHRRDGSRRASLPCTVRDPDGHILEIASKNALRPTRPPPGAQPPRCTGTVFATTGPVRRRGIARGCLTGCWGDVASARRWRSQSSIRPVLFSLTGTCMGPLPAPGMSPAALRLIKRSEIVCFSASQYAPSRKCPATVISPLGARAIESPLWPGGPHWPWQGPACTAAQGRSSLSRSSPLPPSCRAAGRTPRVWFSRCPARGQRPSVPGQVLADLLISPAPPLRPTRGPHPGASLRRGCEATSQLQSRSRSATQNVR